MTIKDDCEFGYVTECKDCSVKDSDDGCTLNQDGCDMCIRSEDSMDEK